MKDLIEIRNELDVIDSQIKDLLHKRLNLAAEVASSKIHTGKKVYDKKREQEKIDTLTADIDDLFYKNCVCELIKHLMTMSRRKQYILINEAKGNESSEYVALDAFDFTDSTVVFQGVEGAYSHAAMLEFFGHTKSSYNVESFRGALKTLAEKKADYCIVPIENSTAGAVEDVYDLLLEYDLNIIGEHILPIEHALLGVKGSSIDSIKTIYSHPQAIRQCERFLSQYPNIKTKEVLNTAVAAKMVKEKQSKEYAAVAGEINSKLYDLDIIKRSIQDEDNNKTRFIILTANKIFLKDAKKITISFELPHEKGSLYHTLSHLAYNNLNLSLIQSRPIRKRNWEYRFFIDIEGNLLDTDVSNALCGLQEETVGFKVLGNY